MARTGNHHETGSGEITQYIQGRIMVSVYCPSFKFHLNPNSSFKVYAGQDTGRTVTICFPPG